VHLLREGSARNPKSETLRPAPDGEIGVIVAGLAVLRLTASSFGERSGVVLVDHRSNVEVVVWHHSLWIL
jgi:hypothetical protein